MGKSKDEHRAEWAISRLKSLPEHLFHKAVILLVQDANVSYVAKWVLAQPERGELGQASYETLRKYLGALRKPLVLDGDSECSLVKPFW